MLERLDGVILATTDLDASAQRLSDLFAAERDDSFTSAAIGAEVVGMRCGSNLIRLATPNGDGAVGEHIDRWGEGLFGAVFSTRDVDGVAARLDERNIAFTEEDGALHIDPAATFGLRTEIVGFVERDVVGIVSFLYEVTHLVADWKAAQDFWVDSFGLNESLFSPISSDQYGYDGMLTLFNPPDRLDRIEVVFPHDRTKAMGRFHEKRGDGPYMFYTECHDMAELKRRLDSIDARYAPSDDGDAPEGLFVHPSATRGTLVGVGRPNLAWVWSGRPELAKTQR